MYLALGALVFLAAIYFSYKRPTLAGLAIPLGLPAYLVRLEIFGMPTTVLELIIWAVFLGFVLRFGFREIIKPLTDRTKWFYIAAGLIASGLILGVLASGDPVSSLGIIKDWFFDAVLAGLIFYNLWQRQAIWKTIFSLQIMASGVGGIAIWQAITSNFITPDGRASAFFSSANYLSLLLGPILVLGAGLIWHLHEKRKWAWLTASTTLWTVAFIGIVFSQSYGSWLGVAGGIFVLVALKLKDFWKPALVSLAGLIALALTQLGNPKLWQTFDLAGRSSSSVRLEVWETAIFMIQENPILGIGLGQFQPQYQEYAPQLFHPPTEWVMLHAHNLFLQFWLYLGFFGFLGFILLLYLVGRNLWHTKNRFWSIVFSAALAEVLIHGLFDLPFWKNDLAILTILIVFGSYYFYDKSKGRIGNSD